MPRSIFAALALATVLAGCRAGASPPTPARQRPSRPAGTTFSEPTGPKCVTRVPPSMGECVGQAMHAEGKKLSRSLVSPLTVTESQCADWSQWQGFYPQTVGLRCVIIQAAYGLNQEPSLREQERDAEQHGIPFGVYDFGEPGISGASEMAYTHELVPHAPLGYWFDAEVSGVFWRSCEFTSEARALGLPIFGVFSYPGGYAAGGGGHCAGYLWASEWGVAGPSPFGGYPASTIKLWQSCGTCFRFGVETDLDQNRGLIELARPAPAPPPAPPAPRATQLRELHAAEHTRRLLHDDIENHRCRKGQHNLPREPEHARLAYHSLCGRWLKQGGREIALERRLRRELG
jgi:hypothetical protein